MVNDDATGDEGLDRALQEAVLEIGGRLREGPSPKLVITAFAADLDAQRGLATGVGLADLAHTIALFEAGVVPEAAARELLGALLALQAGPDDFVADPGLGDLVTNREAWLGTRTEHVGWLGAGRSRREATTVGFYVSCRERLLELLAGLEELGRALVETADAHQRVLFPDLTYLQVAQPTSFAHYLLATAFGVLRDLERAQALFSRLNLSPAGCGSTNGSTLPQSRHRLAELLGFSGLVHHVRDAMWQADVAFEAMAVVVAGLLTADRLVEDLMVYASSEFALVVLDDGHARASKVMPQKKNPFALSYLRGATNRALGDLTAVAASGRMPSGHMDSRLLPYELVPANLARAAGAAGLLAEVVRGLRVDEARARGALDRGFALATDLAERLVTEARVDFREARRVVGRVVADLRGAGLDLRALTSEQLGAAALAELGRSLPLLELDGTLEPTSALRRRRGPGSAAPEAVEALLVEARARRATSGTWRRAQAAALLAAENGLLRRARALAEGET